MIRLLLKTHNVTGQKYLCKTERENWREYTGSGPKWKRHLEEFGKDFSTELLFECTDRDEFKNRALEISRDFDVVANPQFENQVHENGFGGDTVSVRMWITNGETDKYHFKDQEIPEGWRKGRSKCVFNDRSMQVELSNRVVRHGDKYKESRRIAAEKMMLVRDHSKCGAKGANNVACRPEVRAAISKAQKEHYASLTPDQRKKSPEHIQSMREGWKKRRTK